MAPNNGKVNCRHNCGGRFAPKGLAKHKGACARRKKDATFTKQLKVQQRRNEPGPSIPGALCVEIPDDPDDRNGTVHHPDYLDDLTPDPEGVNDEVPPFNGQRAPSPARAEETEINKREPTFESFKQYFSAGDRRQPTDKTPWTPFRSEFDSKFAEFCTKHMLNKDATESLISLIHFYHRKLEELWELASHKCTEYEKGVIVVKYKNEDISFDTYTRPLWDWAQSLIQDPGLALCFVWDAEKVYRFDGETYVRFYHEPWTADAFWAAQSSLPDDPAAKAVCYVIYADKSKLSSFGTQKGYAVVSRLANIVVGVRNGILFGGGQVVGHQPVVKDDPKENGKPAFSNFKNVVWHTAFFKLLESLVQPSKVGQWTRCGDGTLRWLWPVILILAADYEEACVMALIRGLQGLYPCPVCFVPWNEQSDLSAEHPLRTGLESEQILTEARAKRTLAERDEHLKDNGLRDVENAIWKIKGSDPHAAISYDPLHADDGGFWGDHLFAQIKARVEELGRAAIVQIDTQMEAFPRWRGLKHFDTVMNTSFNDGSKHEDIAKMMLFVAHNVLTDDAGLLLLQALRSYLEFRTSIGFEVHTSKTIADGRREVQTLDSTMKNWNFPKIHARRHAFEDIENKGASRNFGTKTSESMHGAMRNTYHKLTNFKDVTPQLVKHDHRRTVATYIREQIDSLAEMNDLSDVPEDEDIEESVLSNVDIGSKLKPISFTTLEQEMIGDVAFERFRIKLGDFVSDFLPAYGYGLPNGRRVRFDGINTITPFQFLEVHYQSLSDWTPTADYLRCNPKFQGHPRYDCVLVKTTQKAIFAQLIYLFSCMVEGKSHPFTLILPFDAPAGPTRRKDRLLRFRRVRAKARKVTEFISVHSIIRGAVLVPDFDKAGEFIVFDVLDGDISLRLKDQ
ncbi:hypothetical protein B0H16DRAFT_1665589 [Mycena metata]|uniref:Uncharacterized protein n=1 Tax=Mycena metata TaxID=1033252 RepID=A0AAD7MQN3_9AGAR|nr:hypothetical protein B0H16DRAFT_1665589 [Mycena metata]